MENVVFFKKSNFLTKANKIIGFVIFSTFLNGCVSPPPPLSIQPKTADFSGYVLSKSSSLEETSAYLKHINSEKNIVYFQTEGGGGATLGVLFGALGSLANVGMISSKTASEAKILFDKVNVKPQAIFMEAAKQESLSVLTEGSNRPKVTPYIYVTKANENKLSLASALIVEYDAVSPKWVGRYLYQLPQEYSFDGFSKLSEAQLSQIKDDAVVGFSNIIKVMNDESFESKSPQKKIMVESEFLSPKNQFKVSGTLVRDNGMTVLMRAPGAVYELQKSKVTYEVTE